jgi:carboxyl-terminal processing protease
MLRIFRALPWALLLLLAACGGSNVPGPTPAPEPVSPLLVFPKAATLLNLCEKPRPGLNPYFFGVPFPDKQGTLADEMAWIRSWINENYLWYNEVPYTLFDPAKFTSAIDYFAVMKSTELSPSAKAKDQFHFTQTSDSWDALQVGGIVYGYGVTWGRGPNTLPRNWVAVLVEKGSPAQLGGIRRGDKLIAVDDTDFLYGNDTAALAKLNAGLFPTTTADFHRLQLERNGASYSALLKPANVITVPVQNTRVIDTPTGKVGYLTFNSHTTASERQLIDAMQTLKAAKVTDLVLDLRYNGGGYLSIASEMAYMIAGPANTTNKIFERLQFNDKRNIDLSANFPTTGQGFSAAHNEALPTLGLKRVTILATGSTCSASESIINGLRGVDIEVTLIGGQTCGKPYGFYATPNCGTTYFAVEFQGVNNKGFGDYADGFAPTCPASDDVNHALGDTEEGMLAAALYQRQYQACPTAGARATVSAAPLELVRPFSSEVSVRNRANER